MQVTAAQLEECVQTSDSAGGPGSAGCDKYWTGFSYVPSIQVTQQLDPFSEAYVAEQTKLYEELAGHSYDVRQHEHTDFDVERYIAAVNPYGFVEPKALAVHIQRLSRALRFAAAKSGDVLVDMGCGWGLSSEL